MDPGWPITPVQKRSVRLHFILWSSKSSEKSLWQFGDSIGDYLRVRPILYHMLSSIVIRMFNLSIVSLYVVIMYKFCGSCIFLLHSIMCCHLRFGLWIESVKVCVFLRTHSHAYSWHKLYTSFRPFRRKYWLRSREILFSAMASRTFPEFMVLITSWGNNLRAVIKKCSHLNRTLSVACNGSGSRCLTSPLGTTVRSDSVTPQIRDVTGQRQTYIHASEALTY